MEKYHPKFTKRYTEPILEALRRGHYITVACDLVGIGESTYHDWVSRGERGEKRYIEFSRAVKKARAEAENTAIVTIQAASIDSWQAAAWILERSRPERWARKERPLTPEAPTPADVLQAAEDRDEEYNPETPPETPP